MIYAGQNEMPVYLGADEITAIYAGSEQIYPYSISGFTVRPTEMSFNINGGSKNIRITSEYDWVAETNDSWITLSATAGTSGRSSIVATIDPNQTGTELSGTVVVSTSNLATSTTIDVISKTEFVPVGYLRGDGQCRLPLFDANAVYTTSGTANYMRLEFNMDFVTNTYLWATSQSWFSFEQNGSSGQYCNVGSSTFICRLTGNDKWNTSGTSTTDIFTFNDNTLTGQKYSGETLVTAATSNWNGTIPTGTILLFPSNGNAGTKIANFYRMKVYDSPTGDPIFDFCPTLDNNNVPCLYEVVNDDYIYQPSGTAGTLTFVPFT